MADKKVATIDLKGNGYAKVAERLKAFREENPKGKHESAYEVDVDGSLVFTVFLWKDKADLLDLMKSGITDKDILRSSCDSNGNAKGQIGGKEKDFEKLESIALGRALANLGYLASGDIASSEEMEAFNDYREQQQQEAIMTAIELINSSKTIEELKTNFMTLGTAMRHKEVIEAKDKRKVELS